MKTSRKTAGVTLVVTVLIVMLLLAGVVVVTGQLALSARRSGMDQEATIRAQYVAESGLARSQARLRLVSSLLTSGNIAVPLSVTSTIIQANMLNLCGLSSLPAGVPALGQATLCSVNDENKATGLVNAATSTLVGSNQLQLLAFVKPDAFANSGYALDPTGVNGAKSPSEFWAQLMGQNGLKDAAGKARPGIPINASVGGGSVTSNVGLAVQSVERDAAGAYIVKLSVPAVTAQGRVAASATRQLSAQTSGVTYDLKFERGSFAKYALLTNHHTVSASAEAACNVNPLACSRVTFTSNTLFSGPVHTNGNFLFQGTPYFGGQVTSAGCPPPASGTYAKDATGAEICAGTPAAGAYYNGRFFKAEDMNDKLKPVLCGARNTDGSCAVSTDPRFLSNDLPSVTWNAKFEQLPQSRTEQVDASQKGGLYLSASVSNVDLSVQSNVSLSGRPAPEKVQLISYTQGATTVNLAITKDKKVYIKVGTVWKPAVQVNGIWIDAISSAAVAAINAGTFQSSFNGVIFVNGSVNSLKGPTRPTSNIVNANDTAPALADFSQITIAARNDIHIKTDLKYEASPCSGKNVVTSGVFTPALCNKRDAENILGVYSTDGDVAIDSPAKYTAAQGAVPKDVKIEGVLMASKGSVRVDGYELGNADGSLGQVNLTGGIIENYYGAFGITDGRGFGRNFVYDERTGEGLAPPAFPTQAAWTGELAEIKLNGSQFQQKVSY